MQFTQKDEVWRDRESGVCYTRPAKLKPIAVIDGAGKSTTFGVLLTPYGGHPDLEWDGLPMLEANEALRERLGFSPHCFGQDLLVTEEQLGTRFERLGVLSREVDLEALVREYEAECCDFSNRAGVIASVTRQLQRMAPCKWTCEVYTLFKDYLAHTPPQQKN
jgi:hypothetical protein